MEKLLYSLFSCLKSLDGRVFSKNLSTLLFADITLTIKKEWGDTFEITITNELENNGTGIHWHGIRQLNSCPYDGANGVTECPIPPGHSFTYVWKATQYGEER